jgi:hypothetical protein
MGDDDLLRRLLDIEEIKQLKARYFRLYDARRWDEFRALLTDDVHVSAEGLETAYDNADDYVRSAIERNPDNAAQSVHHGHMPEIEIKDDGTAVGTWSMFDYVERVTADGARLVRQGYGRYDEEYRKENGSWKISSMRLSRSRLDELPPGG